MSRQRQRQGESQEHWGVITHINQPPIVLNSQLVKSLNQMLASELPEIKSAGKGYLIKLLDLYSVIHLMGPLDW